MENFLDIMKEYGTVRADLAAAHKDLAQLQRDLAQLQNELELARTKVQDLELQKQRLEDEANIKDQNVKTLQEMNTAMVGWVSKVLTSVMDFCNLNKTSIPLPQPPSCLPMSITNNFNAPVGQQVASAGCVVSDLQPKDNKPQTNTDKTDKDKES